MRIGDAGANVQPRILERLHHSLEELLVPALVGAPTLIEGSLNLLR